MKRSGQKRRNPFLMLATVVAVTVAAIPPAGAVGAARSSPVGFADTGVGITASTAVGTEGAAAAHCSLPQPVLPNPDGDRCEKWSAVYDSEKSAGVDAQYADVLRGMAVSPRGDRVFTFGETVVDGTFDDADSQRSWTVVAHDAATGDERWIRSYSAPYEMEGINDLTVSPDSTRVYITGFAVVRERLGDEPPLINRKARTIAYSAATGETLWWRDFGGDPVGHIPGEGPYDLHSWDAGMALAVSDTTVYVAAETDQADTDGFVHLLVIAYDAATGDEAWRSLYDTSTPQMPHVRDAPLPARAQLSPDEGILYVIGSSECDPESSPGPCGIVILAYQADDPAHAQDSRLLWTREFPEGWPLNPLNFSPDGSVLYVPRLEGGVVAYDIATGEPVWTADQTGGSSPFVAVGPHGDKTFTSGWGFLPGSPDTGYLTAAYDAATGDEIWRMREDWALYQDWGPPSRGGASSIAVSPQGDRVYVTGRSERPEDDWTDDRVDVLYPSQATVAYDAATGERMWRARYGRPFFQEIGEFVAVGPDGTVFTAGTQFAHDDELLGAAGQFLNTGGMPLLTNLSDWGIQAYEP